jgi:hypothetical protein
VHFFFPGAKGLATGKDGRLSTSKFQLLLWSYVIVFALLSLFFAFLLVEIAGGLGAGWAESLRVPLGGRFDEFLNEGLDETYLLLLGFPTAAAVAARGITTNKVAEGTIVKPNKGAEGATQTRPGQELVSGDDGTTDLGDFQYLLFNLLAIAYFLAQFFSDPAGGLPDMPDTLVGLTGVVAAAYVAKKGIYREPPVLLSVVPLEGAPGTVVELHGELLISATAAAGQPGTRTTNVVFGTTPARIVDEPGETSVKVKVPGRLQPGPTNVRVVRPPGAYSGELPFEVLAAAPNIISVRPTRIKLGTRSDVEIDGSDFLVGRESHTPKNGVTVDGLPVPIKNGSWEDTRVVVALPTERTEIARLGLEPGAVQLIVYDADGRPSASQPMTLESGAAE